MDMADIRMVTMDTMGTRTAMDTAGTVTTVAPAMDTAMAAELTCAVTSLNQVAHCMANTNHGDMLAAEQQGYDSLTEAFSQCGADRARTGGPLITPRV
jgi:hypothetical protein